MEKLLLKAEKRVLFGKKSKKLQRDGIVPGNVFGKGMDSVSVQIPLDDLRKMYRKAHGTHLVYLAVDKAEYPVLIQNIQKNSTGDKWLHVDFKQVSLTQKTTAQVPVVITGELEVVKSGEADMLVLADKLTVECLPTKIPEGIVIDVSALSGIGAEVKIKDLPHNSDYTFLDPEDKLIVQISEAKKEEILAPTAEEVLPEVEVITAKPAVEEGEKPASEDKEEK